MLSEKLSKKKSTNNQNNISDDKLKVIKSNYILKLIYDNILQKKSLEIVKYSKKLQNRLKLSIKDYMEYSEILTPIEIEIIPTINKYGKFINYDINEFFHIYFNDNKDERIYNNVINKKDIVKKINIIIDYQFKSFEKLFQNCECIETINFKKLYRTKSYIL